MNVKSVLSVFIVAVLISLSGHVTYAASNNGTSVYDALQKQSSSSTQQKTKTGTPPQKAQTPLPKTVGGGTFLTFLKLVLALGVVLFLIYLTYRFLGKRTRAFQSIGHIRNLGGVSVGPSRSVQLVKVGDEVLVLGVGENINLLKQVEDEAFLETLLTQPEPVSLRPSVNKWVEWAKETTKAKSMHPLSKASFKGELDQVLKEREVDIEKLINKETGHE